jgi:hypothetical protein
MNGKRSNFDLLNKTSSTVARAAGANFVPISFLKVNFRMKKCHPIPQTNLSVWKILRQSEWIVT